ncbi:conserved hypothetical protein [Trichinella spiralis]|uniref:hypothetical protein n=1 Tax=Trichinella spiralis TaxID=6334 RepID=UPI0001EFB3EA|nr:conserved hypothetical protein [Trichinella spiralis]
MQQLPVFQQSKTKQKAQTQLGCNVVSVCFFAVLLTHLSADVFSEKRSLAASDTALLLQIAAAAAAAANTTTTTSCHCYYYYYCHYWVTVLVFDNNDNSDFTLHWRGSYN